jgi:D-amino-acid dehydrogenase
MIMRVCVLGAGIVGLATAWQLNRQGHQVTVVDRQSPGAGASGGNGAQLSYSYVAPLADPSIWKQLPKLLVSLSSPFKLRPQLDPAQWAWGLSFLAACNARTSARTTRRLLMLAQESREVFEEMQADLTPDCDYSSTGKLVLYADAKALSAAARQVDIQRQFGCIQHVVDARDCVLIEPALEDYRKDITGAIYTPSECSADCLKLCEELTKALRARRVAFVTGAAATGFELRGGRSVAVRTKAGAIEADAFVVSVGAASPQLVRDLGVRLPVYPLKGYSITIDLGETGDFAPAVSVTDSARKTVFARIGSRLRVAGMAELVGHDLRVPAPRIRTLVEATQTLFPRIRTTAQELSPWAGMRPSTPTGVPIIGRQCGAPPNVLFNTGHGALGFTLAFGSARVIGHALDCV